MSVYLHDIPLSEALSRMQSALQDADLWGVLDIETIPLDEHALGRTLAEPVWAKTSSPNYHASAMDGFAVRAADTADALPSKPVSLQIPAEACYLDTGDPVPPGFDSVIPIENTEALDERGSLIDAIREPATIRIRASVAPWTYIRPLGEDIVKTELVLPAGHVLRPVDLGAIAASGHVDLKVSRKPRVAILPTGSELVPIGTKLKPGDILEYNSLVLAAQVKAMGAEPTRLPTLKDDFDEICDSVLAAADDHDLVLLNAGSSAGAEDFSSKVVEKLGQLLVHGVAVRPGHPVILGTVSLRADKNGEAISSKLETATSPASQAPRSDIPIIGVPGYPVSAALTVDIFVEPMIAKWLGRRPNELPIETATLSRKITSPGGDDDFVRVAVGQVGQKLLAAPLSRGAGVITSLVRADGLVLMPSGTQGAEVGDQVQVRLYRPRAELDKTIFCIGSHDMTLDLIAQFLAAHDRRLTSANVGSQGGLVALSRGEAHLAGSHLLDPETGEYNISYIRRYLPDVPVRVVTLVGREQGLLVSRGNPKGIKSLEDLSRPGAQSEASSVRFINRQRGAGTRVLLDYQLNLLGISSDSIIGYAQEEYTHLGVAAAVASDRVDCGMGIAAAAQALELDFVPLYQERYDLVIPMEYAKSELLKPLFAVLENQEFRAAVAALPGYDVTVMGNLVLED
ncbi:MAG: molybdopterin biosynthesis protein [Anaerolineae bacterium]|nr:molybdopterin biosynthesis protein [Anaerolineae bacterium]